MPNIDETSVEAIDAEIKRLEEVRRTIWSKETDSKLVEAADRIAGKWVRINGWVFDSETAEDGFRIGFVKKIVSYEGNMSFKVEMSPLVYIANKTKTIATDVMVPVASDMKRCRIDDVSKVTVLHPKQVTRIVGLAKKNIDSHLDKIIKAAK